MLALGLAASLLVAFWRALRASHVPAIACVLATAYGYAMDGANAVAMRGRSENAYEGFLFVFLGPSGSLGRDRGVLPTTRFFVDHPLGVHAILVLVAGCLVTLLLRQRGRIRPELPRARALDGIASPIVFFGVMESVQFAMNVAMSKLAE
jgi:hypothetical protein